MWRKLCDIRFENTKEHRIETAWCALPSHAPWSSVTNSVSWCRIWSSLSIGFAENGGGLMLPLENKSIRWMTDFVGNISHPAQLIVSLCADKLAVKSPAWFWLSISALWIPNGGMFCQKCITRLRWDLWSTGISLWKQLTVYEVFCNAMRVLLVERFEIQTRKKKDIWSAPIGLLTV